MSEGVASAVTAGEEKGPGPAGPSRRDAAPGRRLLWGGGLLLAGAGLFTLYLFQSGVGPLNSDGASIVLQAQAILHGNPLLQGWRGGGGALFSTQPPPDALGGGVGGGGPGGGHTLGGV